MISRSHAHRNLLPELIRTAALSLAVLTLCAFLAVRPARAAEWMQPYLEQVQEWGVMRGDGNGNLNEDRTITRAEFVTLVNRAFGYTEVGDSPFTDVNPNDWYAEDISIAHQAGYFNGTSATTASPLSPVTREQAAVLLGRCLRLQGTPGVSASTFNDIENIGGWSRGLIQEAADLGIIQGYADGTFRPDVPITRGQMACFLVRALGTLIQEPGDQTSGGVYGNLTINVPGVKLTDTTITGNLYLTGGVGLGNLELENVTVLGKIVICGSGEAERGENSIILRNVTAGGLEVDSLMDQFLSIRAEGFTSIDSTTVRTSAYLEDLTEDGLGLKLIRLDGAGGVRLQLAGNIKEVLNLTPNSILQLAQGVAGVVTMDERAVGASLTIDVDSVIKELNLDTATPVTGAGSVTRLNVNAAGSEVSMLPDTIYVRPGINSTVANQTMDNKIANESSDEPRILAGYPAARNIAPTSADAVFRTNKAGTIRWALTALMDGSLGEEDLLNPASNARVLRSGTINATASNTDFTARLTGLAKEGSYYISALMEDARGHRSAVKVAAFTTPDDTVPAFANGYPGTPILTTDLNGEQTAQIMAMTTKSCQMYYVLLPKGSTAPTAADFRAAAIPGSLGFGVVTMQKNTPFLISRINTSHLAEKTDYDLYLWLNDADNGKSSAVRKITVTTKDITPPVIESLYDKSFNATSVTMNFSLSEPGSLYWAVVKKDATFYASGVNKNDPNEAAKIQIMNGSGGNVIRRGGPVRAARNGTEYSFTISGLTAQTVYDLYYVAVDDAGNYCVYSAPLIPPMEIHTDDQVPPTVVQEFTNEPPTSTALRPTPYPDSTIRLVFSEEVVPVVMNSTGAAEPKEPNFMSAYQAAQSGGDTERLIFANLLREHIKLYYQSSPSQYSLAPERTSDSAGGNWVIDYRHATVSRDIESGEMIIAFPHNAASPSTSAINLGSGESYYFVLSDIADNSAKFNRLEYGQNRDGLHLATFVTVDAQLRLADGEAQGSYNGTPLNFDMNFSVTPESIGNISDNVLWDMIFWSDRTMKIELYCKDGTGPWQKLGGDGAEASFVITSARPTMGISVAREFLSEDKANPSFEKLNAVKAKRMYGIIVTEVDGNPNRENWTGEAPIRVLPVSGDLGSLRLMTAATLTPERYNSLTGLQEIGMPERDRTLPCTFRDTTPPTFVDGYPRFIPDSTTLTMQVSLNREATYYYVITKGVRLSTILKDGTTITDSNWDRLPEDGKDFDGRINSNVTGNASRPDYQAIANGNLRGDGYIPGNRTTDGLGMDEILITSGLEPNTRYTVYFALEGDSEESISDVYAFRFTTGDVRRPIINSAQEKNTAGTSVTVSSNQDAQEGKVLLMVDKLEPESMRKTMAECWADNPEAGATADQIATYKGYSILRAMQEHVYTDGTRGDLGSVFDLFADTTTKQNVTNDLLSASANGSSITKVVSPFSLLSTDRPSLQKTVLCEDGMTDGNQTYNFVVMMRTSSGNVKSEYAFSAVLDLTPGSTPLYITKVSRTNYTTPTTDPNQAFSQGYSGRLTVTFSTPLYFNDPDKGRLQVVDMEQAASFDDSKYKYSYQVLATYRDQNQDQDRVYIEPQLKPTDPDAYTPITALTLQYVGLREGADITFSSFLCNRDGLTGGELKVKMHLERNEYELFMPEFTIE